MLKICQRPELIQQLEHGLTFASDAEVNNALLTKYSLWDYLTPCDADNINILNACINRWREEANKLFETTLFEYDPLLNYNIEEKGKDTRKPDLTQERSPDLTDETSFGGTITTAETGYNTPRVLEDTAKSTNGGKDTTTRKGKETTTHKGTDTTDREAYKRGTMGATQDIIEKERKIILDCVAWYVDKFRSCFTLSLDVASYDCPTACEEEVFAEFAPCGDGVSVSNKLDTIDNEIGHLNAQLDACCKSMSESIDDLKKFVADSKTALAAAISDKGIETASDATFAEMCDNIAAIPTGSEWILYQSWDFVSDLTDSLTGSTFGGTWAATVSDGVTFSNEGGSRIYSPSIFVQPRPGIAFEIDFGEIPYNRSTNNYIHNCFNVRNNGAANGAVVVCSAIDTDHDPYAVYFITSPTNNGTRTWTKICDSTQDLAGKTLRIEMVNRETFIGAEFKIFIDGEYITTTVTDVGANYLWGSAGYYSFGATTPYQSWLWTLKGFRVYYRTE